MKEEKFFISQIYIHWNPAIAHFMGLKFISYCKVKFKTIPKTIRKSHLEIKILYFIGRIPLSMGALLWGFTV